MTAVLDANCFKGYVDAMLAERSDVFTGAIEKIFETCWIALDTGRLLYQEWRDCTGGFDNIFVSDLIAGWEEENKVRYTEFVKNKPLSTDLVKQGVPRSDARIVEFSHSAGANVIVSHDVDLYEPKEKKCSAARRYKLVHERNGSVCRHIQRQYGISVTCCCNVENFL